MFKQVTPQRKCYYISYFGELVDFVQQDLQQQKMSITKFKKECVKDKFIKTKLWRVTKASSSNKFEYCQALLNFNKADKNKGILIKSKWIAIDIMLNIKSGK